MKHNAMVIDKPRHEIKVNGREVYLAPKEWEILNLMKESNGEVLSREVIQKKVWKHDIKIDTRTVDQHIARLRRKLKIAGLNYQPIVTVPSFGYKFKA